MESSDESSKMKESDEESCSVKSTNNETPQPQEDQQQDDKKEKLICSSVSDHSVVAANASNSNDVRESTSLLSNSPKSRIVKSLSDPELCFESLIAESSSNNKRHSNFKKNKSSISEKQKDGDDSKEEKCILSERSPLKKERKHSKASKYSSETESPRNMVDSDEIFTPAYCVGYTSDSVKKVNEKHSRKTNQPGEEQKCADLLKESNCSSRSNTELKRVRSYLDFDRNWQCTKSSIKERMSFMFNNELMADVHFIMTNDGKESSQKNITIPAHKFVLSISSSVFDAMFNGQLAHPADDNLTIEITDIEPAAFLNLLRFFYTDQVTLCPETVMATLYAAKKYAASLLEFACVDYLKSNLNGDNACMLLAQARLFDEPQLATMCLEVIDHSTLEAVAADSFTEIDLETLCIVLQRDSLEIRESNLYSAVIRWAQAECSRNNLTATAENQRRVLDKALNFIRFPLMSIEEFASGPAQSNLLSDKEVVQIFLYFTAKPRPSIRFSDAARCCVVSKEECVCRFGKVEKRWGYSGHTDRIRFMVSRKIYVVGFGLYGSIHSSAKYFANIQLMHSDFRSVCGENDVVYSSQGNTETIKVMFKEPIEISPNVSYTACATIQGPDSYYGAKGVRKVVAGKTTFQFFYNAGNNNGTSVEDGQLPEIYFYT